MELELTSHREGILLPVQAQAGARRNAVVGLHGGRLKVAVTVPAEKGKANAAILEILTQSLQLKRAQVSLHAGETNPHKVILITGCALAELRQRLRRLLDASSQ